MALLLAVTLAGVTEKPTLKSTVYVRTPVGEASGILFGNFVLTCAHAYEPNYTAVTRERFEWDDDKFKKLAKKVTLIATCDALDVVLLQVEGLKGPKLTFAEPTLGEMTYSEGYSLGFLSLFFGRIARIEETAAWVDINLQAGASGSAVFDSKGRVVGMFKLMIGSRGAQRSVAVVVRGDLLGDFINTVAQSQRPAPKGNRR